jgi:hypothetical protein
MHGSALSHPSIRNNEVHIILYLYIQNMPTVLEAIAESNTIAGLLSRMDESKRCLDIVLKHIPLGLHTSAAPGPLNDGEWCLLVSNASAVAKFKQLLPMLIAAIRGSGIDVKNIRLKRNY